MAGFIKSIQQSVYLKLMFVAYGFTLLMLGSHLARSPEVIPKPRQIRVTPGSRKTISKESEEKRRTLESVKDVNINIMCKGNKFPTERLKPETWQKVGPDASTLVFSAYHEARAPDLIKIIGLSVKRARQHFCQIWYKNSSNPDQFDMTVTNAAIAMLHSSPMKYISCAIKCPIPAGSMPFAVSLVSGEKCAQPDNVVAVTHIPETQKYSKNFTVCLSPLNFRYGRAYELVEWIELNRILGANNFVVYNYSSAVNVNSVLEYYKSKDVVDLIQWHLPVGVDKWPPEKGVIEVHYFAQTAAFNDCLLRSRGTSEFIVILDLDEFIIPHGDSIITWQDVINKMPRVGAYMFRNSFFRKEWTQKDLDFPEKEQAEKFKLVSLLKVGRETKVWAPKQRTKYIARTSAIEVAVTHDLVPSNIARVVDPGLGLLHHYRNWLKYDERVANVTDKTVVQKYSKQLVDRVSETWSRLENVVLDIPIE